MRDILKMEGNIMINRNDRIIRVKLYFASGRILTIRNGNKLRKYIL